MVFNVHYIVDTKLYAKANKIEEDSIYSGKIVAYQEGPDESVDEDLDLGCSHITFPAFLNIFVDVDKDNYNVAFKVDINKEKLVPLKDN